MLLYQMRSIYKSMSKWNAYVQNRRNHYHGQIGLPDKARPMNGLVVCNIMDVSAF